MESGVKKTPAHERREVSVRGIVQGVGFRPFVYSLALRHGLSGMVRNDAEGVQIEVEGLPRDLDLFIRGIQEESPALAVVETLSWRPQPTVQEIGFRIEQSQDIPGRVGQEAGPRQRKALISPDVAVCEDCLRELFNPLNRRYRYAFVNCTNCGPRYTITRAVPYDRAATTMSAFPLCLDCQREYDDPGDRRFHAQPNACPVCGPRVRLLDRAGGEIDESDPIARTAELLRSGAIIAIKGLGGFHLACDPFNTEAVKALRWRKARQDKPFALMARNISQVWELCRVRPEEETLLRSPARPIVLLDRRADCGIAEEVAPRQKTLGVMLAYTPLHHLLLEAAAVPLVMTSGNRSDEPIAYRDEEALQQLGQIADFFLSHNRPIHIRCDDSVLRMSSCSQPKYATRRVPEESEDRVDHSLIQGLPPGLGAWGGQFTTAGLPTELGGWGGQSPYFLRRSRGYAPAPLQIAWSFGQHILACGGHLKNTFCAARDQYAFLSHHIGDLENYESLRSFREGIQHFCQVFDIKPELVVHDLHPEYLSTRYAREMEEAGVRIIGVQHHHAHIASCLAENSRPVSENVIGIAFDGTGYGTDGAIWGGEFLEGSIQKGFIRRGRLEYIPLPGGDGAIRQPWRIALGCLISLYGEEGTLRLPLPIVQQAGEHNVRLIARMLEHSLNTPYTSSAGRLFDVAAALLGVPGSQQVTYEGQAAIELELLAHGPVQELYLFRLSAEPVPFISASSPGSASSLTGCWVVETEEVIAGMVHDLLAGQAVGEISSRFHRTMAEIVTAGCLKIREAGSGSHPISAVALSGGTFQNELLLGQVVESLERSGFVVYRHHRVPPNDGGLCLGQAVLGDMMMKNGGGKDVFRNTGPDSGDTRPGASTCQGGG